MSAQVSNSNNTALVEQTNGQTVMAYDKGSVPFYVVIVWLALIISYVVYMAILALPDLKAWAGL